MTMRQHRRRRQRHMRERAKTNTWRAEQAALYKAWSDANMRFNNPEGERP